MITLLLGIIYISFISLGLPDSLLGSAWPAIYQEFSLPVSYAGFASMLISGGTILSSFFSERIIRKLGTGLVTAISVLMTALALLGISISPGFIWLCFMAIPLGLGAGSVDAALNNFVALHYKARHMSWLHCFWGVGATLGPVIMSYFLLRENQWKMGFRTIGILQMGLVIFLFLSIPIWKKLSSNESDSEKPESKSLKVKDIFKIPKAKLTLLSFFCYGALEATTGLWGSSYLVFYKKIPPETGAKWISLFYLGITLGRFISGFVTIKLNNKKLLRLGQILISFGIISLVLPLGNISLQFGLLLIGLGCAPIFPCMLHETPNRFGKNLSQCLMGIQMACAYIGTTFMPPLFGLIVEHLTMSLFPGFLLLILLVMVISTEKINLEFKS